MTERKDGEKNSMAERIRAARSFLEMNQTEFAQALGVSQSYLSYMENGASQPSVEVLRTLHEMTGWRYEWLIEGDEQAGSQAAPEEFQRRAIRNLIAIMDYKELNFIRRFIELYHKTHKEKAQKK